MAKLRAEYLACYDITDNRVRNKVFNLLLDYGLKNIQYSVFWGYLSSLETTAVKQEIPALLAKDDHFILMPVNARSRNNFYWGHSPETFSDWDEHIIL